MNYILGQDTCIGCGGFISYERIIAIPGTRTCTKCSSTPKVMGKNVFAHKTGSEIQVMSPETWNTLQRLDRRGTDHHRQR